MGSKLKDKSTKQFIPGAALSEPNYSDSANPPTTLVTFFMHGAGQVRLPALHTLSTDLRVKLMNGEVRYLYAKNWFPIKLMYALTESSPNTIARFFEYWLFAGLDFERAINDSWSSLHGDNYGWGLTSQDFDFGSLQEAEVLWDKREEIIKAIIRR